MNPRQLIRTFIVVIFATMQCAGQMPLTSDEAVMLKTSSDNSFICPDKKEVYLYVDLSASGTSKRIPMNISIVLDRSGSMEDEERMVNAKSALSYLIDHLSKEDIVSIVIYDHVAEVLHGATPVTDPEHVKKMIKHVTPRGKTNISMGLEKGYEEVKSSFSPDRLNRVILISDGLANEGITDDYLLELIVKDHSQRQGISLSSFGMGHEYNEKLMHNLAEYGGGNYYFIERPADAIKDFDTEVKMLLNVVAQQGMLKIKYPSPALKINHVYGFPYTSSSDEIKIDLKEVHPNEMHGVLIKFNIVAPVPDSLLFTTSLQYINAISKQAVLKTDKVVVRKSESSDDCANGLNRDVINKVVFFTSNYYLDSASDHAENGDFDKAHQTLQSAKQMHDNAGAAPGSVDPNLNQQYQLIQEYQDELKKNKNAHPNQLKLLHKRMRHQNYKMRKMKT